MRSRRTVSILALLSLPLASWARDDRLKLPIDVAMAQPVAREKLSPDVALYFGDAPHPEMLQDLGETMVNRKTNAFAKSDAVACQWVFVSVAIELQQRARAAGGNAVVGIESYYKKEVFKSDTQYMCGAGATIAGVALRGRIAKLAPAALPTGTLPEGKAAQKASERPAP